MALSAVLKKKADTPYSKLAPLHITVVRLMEQPKVLSWEFGDKDVKPLLTKKNAVAVISDGDSLAKVTLLEDIKGRVREGGSYFMRGYKLRGDSPPYLLLVTRETMFYRSSALEVREELQMQAQSLLEPQSPLVHLRSAREKNNFMTVEAEVSELTSIKKITMGKEEIPFRKISVKQDGQEMAVCLWREAAVLPVGVLGSCLRLTHLKTKISGYGLQLHSTSFTGIEESSQQKDLIIGAYGVAEVEGSPGTLELLLEGERRVHISESLWAPVEKAMQAPPILVRLELLKDVVQQIDIVV